MNKIHHHITDGIKTITNKPFPHYAPVSKHKEMRTRLGRTISYKSLYFVQECEKGLWYKKTSLFPFIDGRKPTIIKAPVNQSAHIGSNVTFNCTVSGDPAPAVNWTKDGNLLPFNQNVLTNLTTGESQLVIRGVRMDDTGKYRCVASNSMGTERSRAAALLVLGKVLH